MNDKGKMDFEICYAPYEPHGWRPPVPTAASYRALLAIGITGVRLQYNYDDPLWWPSALNAAIGGGMEVTGNFCTEDATEVTPTQIEERAAVWMREYGHEMKRVSFGNEPGYSFGDDDVSKGGTHDYMREYVDQRFLPFLRGVRHAKHDAIIGGCDAESQETQRRFIEIADSIRSRFGFSLCDVEMVHPYGPPMGGADYATREEFEHTYLLGVEPRRPQYYSEIDCQQFKSAIARGERRGQASEEELQVLLDWVRSTHEKFPRVQGVAFGNAEYFFTRIPSGTADDTWSTWTYGEQGPQLSPMGERFRDLFAEINGPVAQKIDMRNARRRTV